jgi:Ca-activated chloride channel family protein
MRRLLLHSVFLCGSILVLIGFISRSRAEQKQVPSIYIVTVRGECAPDQPVAIINGRMVTMTGSLLPAPPSDKPALLTRFADDPLAGAEVVSEMKKNRAVRVVDRIEKADLVFHVCSVYWSDIVPNRVINNTNQAPVHRVAARSFAIAAAKYEAKIEAYPRLLQAAIWKADTLDDGEARELRERGMDRSAKVIRPTSNLRIISSGAWKPPVSPAELVKRFSKESAAALKQWAARPSRLEEKETALEDLSALKIETTLVVVPVSVFDRDGKYIPDLKRENFEIYEDGIKQEISDFGSTETPFHVALLLDMSGSTRWRSDQIQEAALAFVDQLRPADRVMVITFESAVRIASEFTSNREEIRKAILESKNGGETRVFDAVDLVLTERLNHLKGRKAMVVFSDGVDTSSKLAQGNDVIGHIEEAGTLVYSIRYDTLTDVRAKVRPGMQLPHPQHPGQMADPAQVYAEAAGFLKDLADRSGGRYYDVDTIGDLRSAFTGVAEELRRQYWIGYYPTNQAHDGRYRKIRVTVDQPEVALRTREGYRPQEVKR